MNVRDIVHEMARLGVSYTERPATGVDLSVAFANGAVMECYEIDDGLGMIISSKDSDMSLAITNMTTYALNVRFPSALALFGVEVSNG